MESASGIRSAADWAPAGDYSDIRYETAEGIAKITIRTISGIRIRRMTRKIVAEAFLEVDSGTRQRGGRRSAGRQDACHRLFAGDNRRAVAGGLQRAAEGEAAKHPEVELKIQDAQDKTELQVQQMEGFITQKMDAILVSPKESAGLTKVVEDAYDAQIPIRATGVPLDEVFGEDMLGGGYRKKYLRATSRLVALTHS